MSRLKTKSNAAACVIAVICALVLVTIICPWSADKKRSSYYDDGGETLIWSWDIVDQDIAHGTKFGLIIIPIWVMALIGLVSVLLFRDQVAFFIPAVVALIACIFVFSMWAKIFDSSRMSEMRKLLPGMKSDLVMGIFRACALIGLYVMAVTRLGQGSGRTLRLIQVVFAAGVVALLGVVLYKAFAWGAAERISELDSKNDMSAKVIKTRFWIMILPHICYFCAGILALLDAFILEYRGKMFLGLVLAFYVVAVLIGWMSVPAILIQADEPGGIVFFFAIVIWLFISMPVLFVASLGYFVAHVVALKSATAAATALPSSPPPETQE